MGGPGVDPHYNGTAAEAYAWGARQAARALADIGEGTSTTRSSGWTSSCPASAPATDNGWNTVYTSPCSGVVRQQHIPAAIDRADFNGFFDYITAHSKYKPGVYSAAGRSGQSIFGTGSRQSG